MKYTPRVFLLFLLLALPYSLLAQQALTGSITGTVLDASGAAVPNAEVTVHSTLTGLERTTTTGDLGQYTVPALPVGEYEVSVKASGFADQKTAGVKVGVGQTITVSMQLAVGAQAQQVNVSAEAAAIETTRSSVASSVGNNQIANL